MLKEKTYHQLETCCVSRLLVLMLVLILVLMLVLVIVVVVE